TLDRRLSASGSQALASHRASFRSLAVFIYVILANGANRAAVRQRVLDRINVIRPQLPPDANVTLGPDASSMGWIYQYAIVDRQGAHDLRELRLVNESSQWP